MNFKDITIKIEEEDPFINCKLGRKQYAEILENIVLLAPEGCVIALNGEWGIGKTTFIKMWLQYLTNKGFKTLYFNAWETDFVQDPLIGILGEFQNIEELVGNTADWGNLLKVAGEIFIDTTFSFVRFNLSKIGLEGGFDKAKDEIFKYIRPFREEIIHYKQECKSLENFKCALSKCISSQKNNDKPLVFIIDELDRCNPHYAVKVLERIKHLFMVPHIVFVLAIDKEQLCNSIRGYFGSDRINADEYLRRFIDIDYSLPAPNYESFFDFLYSQYGFESILYRNERTRDIDRVKREFSVITKRLFQAAKFSLRQMEKMMVYLWISIKTYKNIKDFYPYVFVMLTYLKNFHTKVYQKIDNHEYDTQTYIEAVIEVLPISFFQPFHNDYGNDYKVTIANIFAQLLLTYKRRDEKFYEQVKDDKGDPKINLLFKLPNIIDEKNFKEAIEYYASSYAIVETLPYMISHIEIQSGFQFE